MVAKNCSRSKCYEFLLETQLVEASFSRLANMAICMPAILNSSVVGISLHDELCPQKKFCPGGRLILYKTCHRMPGNVT